MTTSNQVSRLLALVPYLQRVGDADLTETANYFGVTKKQLVADLNVLWFCGLPGGLPDDLIEVDFDAVDEGVIRLGNADFLSRPMRFTPDEAMSLIVALESIGEVADPASSQAVYSALAKLGQAQGAFASAAVAAQAGSADLRERLLTAIEAKVVVRLRYAGAQESTPEVEPARIITSDGYGYLQAWSRERNAWRVYRLDRILDVTATPEPAPERKPPEPFGPDWLERRAGVVEVEIEVAESAAWIAEYYPVREARKTPAGRAVRLLVADPAWFSALLLRLGDQVLAVDPDEALAPAKALAVEALAHYA